MRNDFVHRRQPSHPLAADAFSRASDARYVYRDDSPAPVVTRPIRHWRRAMRESYCAVLYPTLFCELTASGGGVHSRATWMRIITRRGASGDGRTLAAHSHPQAPSRHCH
jgi:hypothetical protein